MVHAAKTVQRSTCTTLRTETVTPPMKRDVRLMPTNVLTRRVLELFVSTVKLTLITKTETTMKGDGKPTPKM